VESVLVAVKGWLESQVGFEAFVKERGWSFGNRLKRVGLKMVLRYSWLGLCSRFELEVDSLIQIVCLRFM